MAKSVEKPLRNKL